MTQIDNKCFDKPHQPFENSIPSDTNDNNDNNDNENLLKENLTRLDNTLFNNEYINTLNISFTTTIQAKVNHSFHDGKLILKKNILTVAPIHIGREIKGSKKLVKPPSYDAILHPILTLNFDLITAELELHKDKHSFIIYVLGSNTIFEFKLPPPSTNEMFNHIVLYIQTAIMNSKGYNMNLIGISKRVNFYCDYYISLKDFETKAKSGDVLIFRGLEMNAKCQRCFTQADYDHVALLIRKSNGLFVYEATSRDGVKLRHWREFTCYFWNLLYEKIVYRELIISSYEEHESIKTNIQNNLLEYIEKTQGKTYRLKGCGICYATSNQGFERVNDWQKEKGFFCSQLVAGAFYSCKVMPYVVDSRRFLPGAFSKDGDMPFEKGFELGIEQIIDFTE